jgi:hypothetical protein
MGARCHALERLIHGGYCTGKCSPCKDHLENSSPGPGHTGRRRCHRSPGPLV